MKKITLFLFFAVFLMGTAIVNAQSTATAFKKVTEAFTQVLDSASVYNADWMGSTNTWADRSNDCSNPSGRYLNLSQNSRNMTFKVSNASSFTLSVANSTANRQWNYSINGATPVIITHPGTGCVDTPVAIDDPGEVTIVISSPSTSSASVYLSKISFTPVAGEPPVNDCDYFEDFTNPATMKGTLGAVPAQFDYSVANDASLTLWCNAGAGGNRNTTFTFNNPAQTVGFSKKASVEFDWAVRNCRAGNGEAFLAFRDDAGQTIFVLSTLSVSNNNAAPIQVGVGPIDPTAQPVVPATQKTQLSSSVQTGAGTATTDGLVGVPWYHVAVDIDLIKNKEVTFTLTGINGTTGSATATVPLTAGFALVNGIKDIQMGVSRTQACYWGTKITNICIKDLDATVPDTPENVTLDLTSGQNNQAVGVGSAITNIVYTWGGDANAANVVWTPAGTPDGITVTSDATAKTVTISGAPAAGGTYRYSITSTDGTIESAPLTGAITAIPNTAGGGMPKEITTFVPSDSHYYRIICYGSSVNSSANTSGAAKYLTITATPGTAVPESNGASVLTTTTAFDATDRNIVWEITPYPEKDGYFIIKNLGTNSYFSSAGGTADAIVESTTADDFALPHATTGPTVSGNDYSYFRICRESGPKQIRPSSFNGRWYWDQGTLDRADMVLTIVPVNKSEFPEVPTLALTTSGSNVQTVNIGDAIADIVYTWGGSATEANLTWTSDTPAGITVTPDAVAKTVTISGTPEAIGVYEYSISATDGTAVSATLTGKITVKEAVPDTRKRMAYVTDVTSAIYTAGNEQKFLDAFAADFNVTVIPSLSTGVDYTPYDVVVLSSTPGSAQAGVMELNSKGVVFNKPFVNMKLYQLFASTRWNWVTTASVGNTTQTTIVIPESAKNHPLFTGITFSGTNSDEIILSTGTTNCAVKATSWGDNFSPAAPTVIATVKGEADPAFCYAEIPVGTTVGAFGTTTEKQVVLGLSEVSYVTATPDAVQIALNAAKYVTGLLTEPEVLPTLDLTSGSNAQTITVGDAIDDIVYTWGGSATEANVTWTSTAPAGITVTPDAEAKTVTISGTPEAVGVYEYSISSTNGTAESAPLTGTITVKKAAVVNDCTYFEDFSDASAVKGTLGAAPAQFDYGVVGGYLRFWSNAGANANRNTTFTLDNTVEFSKKATVEFDWAVRNARAGNGDGFLAFRDAGGNAIFSLSVESTGTDNAQTPIFVGTGAIDPAGRPAVATDQKQTIGDPALLSGTGVAYVDATPAWYHVMVEINVTTAEVTFTLTGINGTTGEGTVTRALPAGFVLSSGIKDIQMGVTRSGGMGWGFQLTNLCIKNLDSETTNSAYIDFMAYVATVQATLDAETSASAFMTAIKATLQTAIDTATGSVSESSSDTEIADAKAILDAAVAAYNSDKLHFTALQTSITSVNASYTTATARLGTKFLNYSQTALDALNSAIAAANNALATATTTDALDAAKTTVESALTTFSATGRIDPLTTPYRIYSYGIPNGGAGDGAKRFLYNDGTNTYQKLVTDAVGNENDLWTITKGTTGYIIQNTVSGKYLAKTSSDICQTDVPTEVIMQDGKNQAGAIFKDAGFFLYGMISADVKALELSDAATYTLTWKNGYADRARFVYQFEEDTNVGLVTVNVAGDQVIGIKYYNLLGIEIPKPAINEVYITKKIYKSGKIEVVKAYDKK